MIQTRLGNLSDIFGVLKLQELNLYKNLSEEELKGGFVTTPFTAKQIEEIIEQQGLYVCVNEPLTMFKLPPITVFNTVLYASKRITVAKELSTAYSKLCVFFLLTNTP